MCRHLGAFLTTTMFLAVISLVTAAWALNANATQPTPATELWPPAQGRFQEYRETPHTPGYRAFAIEFDSGEWGQGTSPSRPEIAIRQSIKNCRRRAAGNCEIYAIGDIVVHGLAAWKAQVAAMLYQVKRSATNDDLEAVSRKGGGTAIRAIRRSVLYTGARMGNTGAVAAMLDRGVNVNARSVAGVTALLYAASRARHKVVSLLLKRGADVNSRNSAGKTALGLALLAKRFAQPRNYRMDDHDAVINLLEDASGTE